MFVYLCACIVCVFRGSQHCSRGSPGLESREVGKDHRQGTLEAVEVSHDFNILTQKRGWKKGEGLLNKRVRQDDHSPCLSLDI